MSTKPQRFNPVHYFDQGGKTYGCTEADDEGYYVAWGDYVILERELNAANTEIERLENITASGIHTCGEQCQRPMCVMRRQLRDANARITELEKHIEDMRQPATWDPYDPA